MLLLLVCLPAPWCGLLCSCAAALVWGHTNPPGIHDVRVHARAVQLGQGRAGCEWAVHVLQPMVRAAG